MQTDVTGETPRTLEECYAAYAAVRENGSEADKKIAHSWLVALLLIECVRAED